MGFLQLRPGDLVKERYEVQAHLGGGNFGSVYRVRDSVVGNILACKEMHVLNDPDTAVDERAAALDLFKREALTLATLRHPHIPSAYFEQQDGCWHICPRCGLHFENARFCPEHGSRLLEIAQRYYLLMDYIDGETLEEVAAGFLARHGRPLPLESCLEWIAQVGSALRSLHKLGIVHRDVKPDNIKVRSSDGAAMLLDFGLTKKMEDASGYGTVRVSGSGRFGTAGYAPPSAEEQRNPESRSDIYALGMTLYRLLSARDPQDDEQLSEMRSHAPSFFNAQLGPNIDRIIRESTNAERTQRYQKIDDFLNDINELRAPAPANMQVPPFTFADGTRARNAGDLARLLETHPAEAQNYLFNGMFGAWLLQNGFAASAKAAEDAIKEYPDKPMRAAELFRRALYPSTARDIAPRVEVLPQSLSFGTLDSGECAVRQLQIRNVGPGFAWGTLEVEATPSPAPGGAVTLPGLKVPQQWQGNLTIEVGLDTGRVGAGAYAGALMLKCNQREVRIAVDYNVRPLQLKTNPQELDFGTLPVGTRASRLLKIMRSSAAAQGVPRGTLFAGASLAGLDIPERFVGEEPIEITLNGGHPDVVARLYEGAIQLDTNGGRLRVPVRYTVSLPATRVATLIAEGALAGSLYGVGLRLFYVFINPDYTLNWLTDAGGALVPLELHTLGPLLLGAIAGFGGALLVGSSGVLAPTFRARWAAVVPLLGLLVGASLSQYLAFSLHWGVWGLGDWLLHPLADSILSEPGRNCAPLAWGLLGGAVGLALGVGRVFAARGQKSVRYAIFALLGLCGLVVLINAMVHS